jgi:hypothetical protein
MNLYKPNLNTFFNYIVLFLFFINSQIIFVIFALNFERDYLYSVCHF